MHVVEAIPERPALPFIGHALRIPGGADSLQYLLSESKELGPIFKMRFFGNELTVVSGLDLVTELSDETRFRKNVHADLIALRGIVGDGLFTAFHDEPNWRKAHDILLPAFSLGAMRGYHATMLSVAKSLVAKWDSAVDRPVDVAGDMTRLTFDTIGLCGFGYDFESFRRDQPHPFIGALSRTLSYAQAQSEALPGLQIFQRGRAERYRADAEYMRDLVDDVIRHRRAQPDTEGDDLLGRMVHTKDPATGELLDDVNIRYQVLTFLIAGHETTSGALSFALHYLTKHPEVLASAQAEVDALWGDDPDPEPSYADIGKLTYLRQVLNESLRLWPTAPAYAVEPVTDTMIGGRYAVRAGESLLVNTAALHRDPAWGENLELFDPQRFAAEAEATRPAHLFKPFGSGERACIGRQFALHEATLVLGLLVHRYRLIDHADYQLKIKQTLTIKPDGFTLRLARRGTDDRRLPAATPGTAHGTADVTSRKAAGTTLTVLYGSNLGTCAGIARDLAADGAERGFTTKALPLDEVMDVLPHSDDPVVIVTASYNGKPTDDAARFYAWLEQLDAGALARVRYALLGVGDRNWAATYQHIPSTIEQRLTAAGADAVIERGVADASGDFAGAVDRWTALLWSELLDRFGAPVAGGDQPAAGPGDRTYTLEDVGASVTDQLTERHGLTSMEVLDSHELADMTHPLGRSKRFVRLRLPDGVTYRTGDHLTVLPHNPAELVDRVAERFALDLDRTIRLHAHRRGRNILPVDRPLTLRRLLTEFVELQDPATREHIAVLAEHTACPPERRPLAELAAAPPERFDQEVNEPRRSVLDLLCRYRSCTLPFEIFLKMLPTLRPRHYSISSSSLATPGTVDLMVSLLAAPHRNGDGTFRGIGSHYLGTVRTGDTVQARVNPCREAFRLPGNADVPVILVSAGTGLAPFRGAILDRLHTGEPGTLLCYFGCDHPEVDYLHRSELEAAQEAGAVSLRPAFTHAPENDARFVQHRMRHDSHEIWGALQAGGHIYVCGDGARMAPGVRQALKDIYCEHTGADATAADAWLVALTDTGHYVEDVWQ
ncbi:bifunctional cytochrome P450/NADPH--P450 reductase [Nocardia sp. NPDC020380]|uniref:bifunctional cytochrome P450/NADPH--P450 reductase n=1 Tax=Nocardia sp. NPDC020380 TaxID=3364309 RepID=UPI003787CE62